MSILVKNMKMPTRCWDCPFYETGHEESYCGLTQKDVARWTPTPRPDDCPLVEVEPRKHGHWIRENKVYPELPNDGDYYWYCSECGGQDQHNINVEVPFCWHCGAKMDEVE